MRDSARALRLFAFAWAARSFVDVSLDIYPLIWGGDRVWISYVWNGQMALSLAFVAVGCAALARADVDRRVRIVSTTVAGLFAARAVPFLLFVVLDLLGDRHLPRLHAFVDATHQPSRFLELAVLGCAFMTARSAGAKVPGWLAGVASTAAGLIFVREWLPPHRSYFAAESRSFLFLVASITVAAWGVLVPLDAASQLRPEAKEDPEAVKGRRVAMGLGAWLFAALLFVGSAIFLAAEKMPTWTPYYVQSFAALFASAGAIALAGPAKDVSRRRVCIAAAIAWAAQGATLYLAVRFAQAMLWDAMDGREISTGVSVSTGIARASWYLNIAGVLLVSAILHGFARHLGRELLARIALAASFPLAVGILLEITRAGERPRSGWVDLAFAGCSVLAYGMFAFASYRILFAPDDEPRADSQPEIGVASIDE